MPRIVVLALGALLWGAFAIVTLIHVASGDWLRPALTIAIVTVGMVAYHARRRTLKAS